MRMDITFCRRSPAIGVTARDVARHLEGLAQNLTSTADCAENVPAGGLLWIQNNAAWFPKITARLRRMPREKRPLVAIWHGEPLPPPRSAGLPWPSLNPREIAKILLRDVRATDVYTNWFTLRRLHGHGIPDVLVVSAPGRQKFLAEQGISSHFVPYGYSPQMGRDLGLPRNIDVLFLGALDVPRRNRILKYLEQKRVNLTAVGDWHNPAYWGESRVELLNRSKILLNFPRTAGEYSGLRILLGLANKALVISEPIYDPAPYVPGKHFVMAPVEEIPELVRHYLSREDERARIVEEGYRFALGEATMDRSIRRILALCEERIRKREEGRIVQAAADTGRA